MLAAKLEWMALMSAAGSAALLVASTVGAMASMTVAGSAEMMVDSRALMREFWTASTLVQLVVELARGWG